MSLSKGVVTCRPSMDVGLVFGRDAGLAGKAHSWLVVSAVKWVRASAKCDMTADSSPCPLLIVPFFFVLEWCDLGGA